MTKGEIYLLQSYQLGICIGLLDTFSHLIHTVQGRQDRLIIDGVIVKKWSHGSYI
jgi:hypothetical protein